MKAQWKKTPLEQAKAKPPTRLEAALVEVHETQQRMMRFQQNMYIAQTRMEEYRQMYEDAEMRACAATYDAQRYGCLRQRGVLVEENGQFNFYQDEELDAFVLRETNRRFEEVMNSSVHSLLRTPPPKTVSVSTPWQPHPKLW